jgi:hypothetical protein
MVDAGSDPPGGEGLPGARSAEEQCHNRHEPQNVAMLFQDRYLMLGISCSLDTMLGIFVLGSRSVRSCADLPVRARFSRQDAVEHWA